MLGLLFFTIFRATFDAVGRPARSARPCCAPHTGERSTCARARMVTRRALQSLFAVSVPSGASHSPLRHTAHGKGSAVVRVCWSKPADRIRKIVYRQAIFPPLSRAFYYTLKVGEPVKHALLGDKNNFAKQNSFCFLFLFPCYHLTEPPLSRLLPAPRELQSHGRKEGS